MYDPNIGRWISQDPIGFEGGDPNLYRYVHDSPPNATDPSGEIWTLPTRDKRSNYAETRSTAPFFDRIADLATRGGVGLDAAQFASWLTVTDKNGARLRINWQPGDEELSLTNLQKKYNIPEDAKFFVPNLIVAYWGGEAGQLGARGVNWRGSIEQFERRGFRVVPVGLNIALDDKNRVTPLKAPELANYLRHQAQLKALTGVYIWGHGVDYGDGKTFGFVTNGKDFGHLANARSLFGLINLKNTPQIDPYILRWDELKLPYKLDVACIFTCYGAGGANALASANAPVKYGIPDTLFPIGLNGEVEKLLRQNYDPFAK